MSSECLQTFLIQNHFTEQTIVFETAKRTSSRSHLCNLTIFIFLFSSEIACFEIKKEMKCYLLWYLACQWSKCCLYVFIVVINMQHLSIFQNAERFFPFTFLGSICWIAFFSYLMVWWAHQVRCGSFTNTSEAQVLLTRELLLLLCPVNETHL